jgi:transcriptional regulator with XRE-family HTH domain
VEGAMSRPLDRAPKLICREPLKHVSLRRYPWGRGHKDGDHSSELQSRAWGLVVTIGIAVKPVQGDFIITVSDMRKAFSDNFLPTEWGDVKVAPLGTRWGFLFAGGQMGYARAIQRKALDVLGFDPNLTFDQVKDAVNEAYNATAEELIFHKYVRRFGFSSVSDFRINSYKQLGDRITTRISDKIERFDLGMELLVYGFDETRRARFIHIHGNDVADQSIVNAWAIGTGTFLALGDLHSKGWPDQSIESLIYWACEAKFCAEFADAVGKSTSAYIWYPSGRFSIISAGLIRRLREIWEASRWSPIPDDAADAIRTSLKEDAEFDVRLALQKSVANTQSGGD